MFWKTLDRVVSAALLIVLLIMVLPLPARVKEPVEHYVDRTFGAAAQEAINFLTVSPGEGEVVNLPFKPKNPEVDVGDESAMLVLLNAERVDQGLEPLVLDQSIVAVARKHSFDMWERQYFAHDNLDGETPFDRMRDGGVRFRRAGENLALARGVERAHKGLMDSEGHRKNILDPNFGRVGIGVVDGGIYGKIFTQNFAD